VARYLHFETDDEAAFWQKTSRRAVAAMLTGYDLLEEEPDQKDMEEFARGAAEVADELVLQYRKRQAAK